MTTFSWIDGTRAERTTGRRAALRAAALVVLGLAGAHAAHAAYPDKPIRWIVPAAPAGGADAAARIVAEQLARRLGQSIVIENRPGASGAIGLDAIAKAAPDGYTIGTANLTNIVLNRQLRPNLPFDADKDLVPVAKITTQPNLVAIHPSLPVDSLRGLVAHAKAHPGQLNYGSTGSGSSLHIAGEALRLATGIDIVHVPYKSAPAANTDLMGNSIQLLIDNLSTLAPHVRSSKVRALAVTSPRRSPVMPDVPTVAEAGVPEMEMVVWGGVVATGGTPAPIVQRLGSEIQAILALPEVRQKLQALGYEADPQGPAAFAELIRQENARWGAIIRRANIKAD